MRDVAILFIGALVAVIPMWLLADNIDDDEFTKTALSGACAAGVAAFWKLATRNKSE